MPNPTVIDTVVTDEDKDKDKEIGYLRVIKKTVVFTAFLFEAKSSSQRKKGQEEDEMFQADNEPIWYPTIFFFDLDKCENVWEVFGAD